MYGPIDYDRNWNYVPRTISNRKDGSDLSFKYAYHVKYGASTMVQEMGTLFIPSTIFGSPTGKSDVEVTAKLDVIKNSSIIKSYLSVCYVSKIQGVMTGGINFTELRKKGLMAVKENIEHQMIQDKEFLLSLTTDQ
jgi:hypothetical protein